MSAGVPPVWARTLSHSAKTRASSSPASLAAASVAMPSTGSRAQSSCCARQALERACWSQGCVLPAPRGPAPTPTVSLSYQKGGAAGWKKEANNGLFPYFIQKVFIFDLVLETKPSKMVRNTGRNSYEVARLQFIGQRVVRRDLSDLSPPLSPPSLCFETQDGENTCDTSAFVLALCLRFFRRARAAKGALGQSGH